MKGSDLSELMAPFNGELSNATSMIGHLTKELPVVKSPTINQVSSVGGTETSSFYISQGLCQVSWLKPRS